MSRRARARPVESDQEPTAPQKGNGTMLAEFTPEGSKEETAMGSTRFDRRTFLTASAASVLASGSASRLARADATGGVGARAFQRCRRTDRGKPLLRARFRLSRRNPIANHGAAQLGSGSAAGVRDLDEILELADQIAIMSSGAINYQAAVRETDRATIGSHMAGH